MNAIAYLGSLLDGEPAPEPLKPAIPAILKRFEPRVCTKLAYSKKGAQTARNQRLRSHHKRPDLLRVYCCTYCGKWHLTSKELQND